jgi:hypothetical protein
MEGFYIIFDRNSTRIGFAESTCPVRDKLALKSTIFGGIPYSGQFLLVMALTAKKRKIKNKN